MLFILNVAEEKLFDFRVKLSQSLVLLCVREVDGHISPWRDNVEFGVKHIDPMDNSV